MKLYHTNSASLVAEVLSDGFPVSAPDAGGVRLSDRLSAGPEGLNGQACILFDIPEEEIRQFEFDELGSSAREFAIPAEVLNRYPVVAVRQPERPPAGPSGDAPAPAGSSGRWRWIGLGAVVVLVAGAGYAVWKAGDSPERVTHSVTPPRSQRERPAAPAQPSRPSPSKGTTKTTGSVAAGTPDHGRLVRGVAFPAAGANHFTWNAATHGSPNPTARRYGTDYTVRAVLRALKRYRAKNPSAPKVGIGDLSLRRGGDFAGRTQGHENGLDVVVLYPRLDGAQMEPGIVEQVNRPLTQALLAELARAGATRVALDPRMGLTVPKGMARVLSAQPRMHVRFRKRSSGR